MSEEMLNIDAAASRDNLQTVLDIGMSPAWAEQCVGGRVTVNGKLFDVVGANEGKLFVVPAAREAVWFRAWARAVGGHGDE